MPAAEGSPQPQGLNIVSGGGFSKIFTTEKGFDLSFQEASVNNWRQQPTDNSFPGYTLPDGSVGRGFPDVSAKSDNILGLNGGQWLNQDGTRYGIIIYIAYYPSCCINQIHNVFEYLS